MRCSTVSFRGANLSGASFERTSLANFDFTDANVFGSRLSVENSPQDLAAEQLYSTASYQAGALGPITLAGDMRAWNFQNQDLSGARFDRGSQLTGAAWEGAKLQDAIFFVATLPGTDFRLAEVREVRFSGGTLDDSNFSETDLAQAEFSETSLRTVRFDRAKLTDARLVHAHLEGASFVDADLRGAAFVSIESFAGADFSGADITGAELTYAMTDGFTLDQLRSTRSFQQQDLSGVNFEGNDFTGIDLSGFQLAGADFNRANLAGADFSGADATGVSFLFADIAGLNLAGAIVRRANFNNADSEGFTREILESTASYQSSRLDGIDLSENDLRNWDFEGHDLREARLNSDLRGTLFDLSDLRGAILPSNRRGLALQRAMLSDGTLGLLQIAEGETLTIRPAPVLVSLNPPVNPTTPPPIIPPGVKVTGLAADLSGTLELLLGDDPWKSTVVFNAQAQVSIDGELKLAFDESATPVVAVGKSFDLFNWPTGGPDGQFSVVTSPNHVWDLSNLYTTGVVQLIAIPEPPTWMAIACLLAWVAMAKFRWNRVAPA